MNQTCTRWAFALLVFVPLSFTTLWARNQSNAADSNAIKQAVAGYINPFNRHDALGSVSAFTEDADLTNIRGESYHGKKEIQELFGTLFAGRLKNAHRTATVKSIRFLSPDIASVDADWEMTGTKTDAGVELPPRKGLLVLIMIKHNGEWRITIFHENEFALPPTK